MTAVACTKNPHLIFSTKWLWLCCLTVSRKAENKKSETPYNSPIYPFGQFDAFLDDFQQYSRPSIVEGDSINMCTVDSAAAVNDRRI